MIPAIELVSLVPKADPQSRPRLARSASCEASVVDRQPSGAIEQFAIEQLMAAKSKEGLQQLFVQHAHNNCPKQGCKGRPQ